MSPGKKGKRGRSGRREAGFIFSGLMHIPANALIPLSFHVVSRGGSDLSNSRAQLHIME